MVDGQAVGGNPNRSPLTNNSLSWAVMGDSNEHPRMVVPQATRPTYTHRGEGSDAQEGVYYHHWSVLGGG